MKSRFIVSGSPSLAFILLCALAAGLWIAGGSSRADIPGQAVVRSGAAICLVLLALFGRRPDLVRRRALSRLFGLTLLIVLVQLIPLPPSAWQSLPGRGPLAEAATLAGMPQLWRPIALVPSATFNAAASLLVPLAMLLLLAALPAGERRWLPDGLLLLTACAALVGVLQLTASSYENPLINDVPSIASGPFANRNHFSLLLAIGLLLVPSWVFSHDKRNMAALHWRAPVAIGLEMLFIAMIVASGSRVGLLVGSLGAGAGLVLAQRPLRHMMRGYPRWALPALLAALALGTSGLVVASLHWDRAIAISRALNDDISNDMRSRALPVVLDIIRSYFPIGSGAGGFDPVFRMHEPLELLKPSYFNHAHNDLLEVVLDTGLSGAVLLIAALLWWAWSSVLVWRMEPSSEVVLARIGSASLLLVTIASAFDYPARTPMIMAVVILAAFWLNDGTSGDGRYQALLKDEQHL